jgi:hypothetical protein
MKTGGSRCLMGNDTVSSLELPMSTACQRLKGCCFFLKWPRAQASFLNPVGKLITAEGMNRYQFQLRITADQYLEYYRGTAKHVIVRCTTGKTVQFPASLLQKFVTTEGIHGDFVLQCDDQHKCLGLRRAG